MNSLFTCLHKLNKILKKNITISFTESNNIISYLKQIQKSSVCIMYIPTILIHEGKNYLSCIVVNDEPTTDSLKVLMCPYCIVQFLQNQKQLCTEHIAKQYNHRWCLMVIIDKRKLLNICITVDPDLTATSNKSMHCFSM